MSKPLARLVVAVLAIACAPLVARAQVASEPAAGVTRVWGFAEYGEPLFGPDMAHWPYANPDAPKGGSAVLGAFGSFDTLNTLVERGTWPAGIGLVYDSLMVGSGDELSSVYGHLAEWAEFPEDRSWVRFRLRDDARWHDGRPLTVEDVKFTFDAIKTKARIFLRRFYDDIESAEIEDARTIRFTITTRDTMKPLVTIAGLTVLPKHHWETRDITQATIEPPLGSGPYRIAAVDPGRSITYERVADWWARDLNTARGIYNIDRIRYDYYRDDTVLFEAFMAGNIDWRAENRAQRWVQRYDTPDVTAGRIVKAEVPNESPRGAGGLIMNTRRPQFQDIRVRKAMELLFDFEFIRRTLFFDQYLRLRNWFPRPAEYASTGLPDGAERAILEQYRDRLPAEIFTTAFAPPVTDGSGNIRAQTREALRLLREAGWEVKNGVLVNAAGERFRTEILLQDASFERVLGHFIQNLQRVGIDATIRVVDTAQYQNRTDDYDFDMVSLGLTFFPPPGPELRSYVTSAAAKQQYEGNFAGIQDPVVDALVERIVASRDLADIEATTRALDRVLLAGHYLIHYWNQDKTWIAHWNKFGRPERPSRFGAGGDFPTTWWVDAAKAATLPAR